MLRIRILASVCLARLACGADAYTIATAAGSDWVGDGGPATQAILIQAEGVALDAAGNLYIADARGHRVRQVRPDGTIRTVAGTGVRGFAGDGGPAASAQINAPYGLAVDRGGNLYIADLGNARVRRVGTDGRISTTAAAPLVSPRNLAFDAAGSLYIADFDGHRVYRLPADGAALQVVAGTGTAGFSGEAGAAAEAQVAFPAALGVDPRDGTLYIGDTANHALRRVARGLIVTVARVAAPTGMAVDPSGTVFVADPVGGVVYRIAQSGPASALQVPARDIALGPGGALIASGGNLVWRILASGILTTIAGGGSLAFGDGGDARAARLNHPSGVAADAGGNLYIADRDNHRIRKVSPAGVITTAAGTGQPGDAGDGQAAAQASLNRPSAVSVDAAGNVYIADTGNRRVRRITPQGQIATVALAASPEYAVADASGVLYVADAGRILRVSAGVTEVLASGLRSPRGLALDRAGNLYFTEADAARVLKLTPALTMTALAEGAWIIPRGVAVDGEGQVYVADTGRQQIVRVDPSGRAVAVAGTGIAGFSGDGDAALRAGLGYPWDVAAGADGKLYIADLDNHRVRVLEPAAVAPAGPILLAEAVHAATLAAGPVAPGMLVAIRNTGLGPGDIPEAQFLFDGVPGRFVAITAAGVLAESPATMADSGSFLLDVRHRGLTRVTIPMVAAPAAPGLFTSAPGQAAASNQDGSANSAANPAGTGSVVALYGTGLGVAAVPVSVRIGDQPAEVLYAGPGYAPGVFQINTRLPVALASGVHPVTVRVGESASQPGISLWLH
jgi:uncharacterized protein (TIGR03437 family)